MMQAEADYLDGLRLTLYEQTSTALFSRFASGHGSAEPTGVDARQLSRTEIRATP